MPVSEADWQRLDAWLWCARIVKHRAEGARFIEGGLIRINRLATEKAHARLRVGDVLTLPWRGEVRVLRVLALAARRGPATEARGLYEDLAGPSRAGEASAEETDALSESAMDESQGRAAG